MLQRLTIHNYALIDKLDIELSTGLTIITGETGAGKSILLGALGLILGQRADSGALMDKTRKCVVEGDFSFELLDKVLLQNFFNENDLDFAIDTQIRREVNPDGKSRAFINDTPVNLNQLKELGGMLVDIHSQHETLLLNNSSFQLNVVDAYANHKELIEEYRTIFRNYQTLQRKLSDLENQEGKAKADFDYNNFQLNELLEAKLFDINQEALENELQKLTHSEEIKNNLVKVSYLLGEGEINALQLLNEGFASLQALNQFYTESENFANRVHSARIELKELFNELYQAQEAIHFNPERVEELNANLNRLYHLQKKHRVNTIAELQAIQAELEQKVKSVNSLDEEISKVKSKINKSEEELLVKARKMAANRASVIPSIVKDVNELLFSVGMPNAGIQIIQQASPDNRLTNSGLDGVQFKFSANKGAEFKELQKVASGGELSRLMLCIKSLVARLTALPTIIFDEIDSGISGEVAQRVGSVMQTIAKDRQVLAITHLPQMASKGRGHFWVYKQIEGNKTYSRIKPLSHEERVVEIAKMLSGDNTTQAAIDNARELLSMSTV